MKRGKCTLEVSGWAEIEERVVIQWTAQVRLNYQPAQLYGPPENCYPDESEADIEALTTMPEGFEDKVDEEKVIDKAWDEFYNRGYER